MSARADSFHVALAQINSAVGDIRANAAKIEALIGRAARERADLVVFPELALTGYPPEDLLLKPHFHDAVAIALEELASKTVGVVALVGLPERSDDVYNAVAVLAEGKLAAVYRKMSLPNYGVFDEQRYFQAGLEPGVVEVNGVKVGLTVCEDIWEPGTPATDEALAGAELIVNLSASPYESGKGLARERMLAQRARDNLATVVFCNMVGGQDELVFDGHSLIVDPRGRLIARLPQFEEAFSICAVDPSVAAAMRLQDARHRAAVRRRQMSGGEAARTLATIELDPSAPRPDPGRSIAGLMGAEEEIYAALTTGLRDYVAKNRFERVILGLSGGIDSALAALIAADALGPDHVTCVVMPSPHSSEATQTDARRIAQNLGAELLEIPIAAAMDVFDELLRPAFAGTARDTTEENLQARIRGMLLMAVSNKLGALVLTTGNKSELSVGYATLYGDMAGGFAVLGDVFKGWVYRLVRWRDGRDGHHLVPVSVIERPPSAELRPDQRDDESLPPYELLDEILAGYVEGDLDGAQLVRRGLPADEVERVIRMVDRAEYKRRQAPPGIRISAKAFGRDRRLPITNRFEG